MQRRYFYRPPRRKEEKADFFFPDQIMDYKFLVRWVVEELDVAPPTNRFGVQELSLGLRESS